MVSRVGRNTRIEGISRIVIGTRSSALAVRQTHIVIDLLRARFPEVEFEVRTVRTKGDAVRDRPISEIGDKGVFVRSIEQLLLAGEIDVAVHSLKDMPADIETPGLRFASFPHREDPRDVLISARPGDIDALSVGARVGTSSARRRVQIARLRGDLELCDIRGNVDTRLRKLDSGEYDAIVLAAAGLLRLDLDHRISSYLEVDQCVPDAGQGILAVQVRAGDPVGDLVDTIDVPDVRRAALAERAVVRGLEADCHSPVGALAEFNNGRVLLRAMAATESGDRLYRDSVTGPMDNAVVLGEELGAGLRARLLA